MTRFDDSYITRPIEPDDVDAGFSCGRHALDDYFARHALSNDRAGIGRAYVLCREANEASELPQILGFYTLSMAVASSASLSDVLKQRLPRYPLPVALIGRLAVDHRAQGRRLGEKLLIDALKRVVDGAALLGCVGIIVDAKDDGSERFYSKYDFVTIEAETWPRRMFLPIATARLAFEGGDE